MKAPDKVFFPNDINLLTKLSLVLKQKDDVCYIRKDALLKKIDDVIAHLSDGSLTGYYESLAYKDIRELIESM